MPKQSTTTPEAQAEQALVAAGPPPGVASAVAVLQSDLANERATEALASALAGTYDARYFSSVALSQFRRSPGLWDVAKTPQGRASFVDAVVQAAQYGLPFLAGRAYLVPYRNHGTLEAQLIVGYQGLVDLVTAPGTGVTYVEAAVVYERDEFDYRKGTGAFLRHVPYRAAGDDGVVDRGRATDVWAQVVYASGQSRFDVMNVTEVEAIRQRSRASDKGPWVTDWDPMACKTVLRRICKTLRISLRVMEMLDREDEIERGSEQRQSTATSAATRLRQQVQQRMAGAPAPEPEVEAAQAVLEEISEPLQPASSSDAAEAVDEAVDGLWTEAEPEPQVVHEEAGTPAACGATVSAGTSTYACTLAPGHRGQHSDGSHDWPR